MMYFILLLASLLFPTCTNGAGNLKHNQSFIDIWTKGKDPSEILIDPPMTVMSLIHVVRAELEIYELLKTYGADKGVEPKLRKYFKDFDSVTAKELATVPYHHNFMKATHIAKNPNAVLRLLWRMLRLLRPVLQELEWKGEKELLREISLTYENVESPTEDEYLEQIEMMLYFHAFYGLDPMETANGKFLHLQTVSTLLPSHLLDIAEFGRPQKIYNPSYFFYKAALKINEERPDKNFDTEKAKRGLKRLIKMHNEDLQKQPEDSRKENYFSSQLSYNLDDPVPTTMNVINTKKFAGKMELLQGRGSYEGDAAYYTHRALCAGADFTDQSVKHELFCYSHTSMHPFFLIAPLKVEVMSRDPMFIYFHQVFPTYWIGKTWSIIAPASLTEELRKPTLERLLNSKGTQKQLEDTLLTPVDPRENVTYKVRAVPFKTYFLDHYTKDHPIEKRIEMLTNLHILNNGSEDYLHVNAYLPGVGAVLHQDYIAKEKDDKALKYGWRMNSFLFYLSEAEVAGGIAFTGLGLGLKPKVGDGMFWSVATPEGTPEYRTAHDGCPSIVGHRFVGLRFIREWKNFLKRKCSPNKKYWVDPYVKIVN